MLIKKIIIIIISYYISNYLLIDKKHYDINYFNIIYFKEERYRCIRYIDNNYINIKNENTIANYVRDYPYAKCIKYKNDYIEYVINKNTIIIYNTLIIFLLYINIFFCNLPIDIFIY
jgi:hypothetical protein